MGDAEGVGKAVYLCHINWPDEQGTAHVKCRKMMGGSWRAKRNVMTGRWRGHEEMNGAEVDESISSGEWAAGQGSGAE